MINTRNEELAFRKCSLSKKLKDFFSLFQNYCLLICNKAINLGEVGLFYRLSEGIFRFGSNIIDLNENFVLINFFSIYGTFIL